MSKEMSNTTPETWGNYLQNPLEKLARAYPEISENSEFQELSSWYKERASALPNFEVKKAPLTDGETWVPNLDAQENVESITRPDGKFYSIEGRTFTKKDPDGKIMFQWNQPVIVSRETPMTVKLFNEKLTLPIHGLLGVIKDSEGRMLTTVDQEAMAETPNHAIVRLPIQASASKIAIMLEENPNADKQLSDLLKIYPHQNANIKDLLTMAEHILPIAPEDTNRDLKHNLVLVLPKVESSSEQHTLLEDNGKRKWLTPQQLSMVNISRITNSHTVAAISVSKDAILLQESFAK